MCVLWFVILVTCSKSVLGHTFGGMVDMERLNYELLKNYSTSTPAFTSFYGNTSVTLDMNLVAILDIDEVQQTFSFSGHIEITWEDARLQWNTSAYEGIESMQLQSNFIWYPAFYLLNPADSTSNLNTDLPVYIEHTGYVALRIYTIFKTTCSLDTRRYPFDTQSCDILMSCPRGAVAELIVNEPQVVSQQILSMASEWKLHSITGDVVSHGHSTEIDIARFTVLMSRKSICYITSTIFPMFLLSFLTSFVFLFPSNSEEKLSYLVSIFVSYAVFLNFINDSMPRTSTVISNLEGYLISILIHNVSALLVTLWCTRRCPSKIVKPPVTETDAKCCCMTKLSEGPPEYTVSPSKEIVGRHWIIFGFYATSAVLLLGLFMF